MPPHSSPPKPKFWPPPKLTWLESFVIGIPESFALVMCLFGRWELAWSGCKLTLFASFVVTILRDHREIRDHFRNL